MISQCDFESDLCSWQNVKGTDKFDWARQNSATPTGKTGPVNDHTKGTNGKKHRHLSVYYFYDFDIILFSGSIGINILWALYPVWTPNPHSLQRIIDNYLMFEAPTAVYKR